MHKTIALWSASFLALASALPVAAVPRASDPKPVVVHPKLWPVARSPIGLNPDIEKKISDLLRQMTIEEKVGQVIQPEWKSIKPEEVTTFHIGSIENGGGAVPGGNKHASVKDWVNLIEPYYQASLIADTKQALRHAPIPLMWASDAVHGHNNVYGATLFPHNVGLGAMNDPVLMKKIGAVTALEERSTGMDISFAPTIAVARDDRWGRSYESYSESPAIVSAYAEAMVKGLQGEGPTFLDQDHVIATAKHFLGDGSTSGGRDQGDSISSEADLATIHGAGYKAAVDAGVQSVMASYNSWHGVKMHANKGLLSDVLEKRMGFDGFIMGDWLAHGQIPGCSQSDCPIAFNAGLDVFNQPTDWKTQYANLVREVEDGTISKSRLDEAVRRVLRVKFRAHIFDQPSPMQRPGTFRPIGTPDHRAVARQAVAQSLVLLKNNLVNGRPLLPITGAATVLIAGDGADNLAMQTGGWTLSWQGADNTNADFPGATSIFQGLKAQIEAAGGQALYSPDGTTAQKPDVAIVVFGETPYAEFMGDQADVALHHDNQESLALLTRLKALGIPTVAVLLSGRPLYVNPQINAADAFVAAWLPGSEGQGVADVLLGHKDFTGKLSFSWPKRPDQTPLNVGDANYDPQFPFGYGLTYQTASQTPALPLAPGAAKYGEKNVYFTKGELWNGYKLWLGEDKRPRVDYVGTRAALYGSAALTAEPRPDGSLHAVWNGKSNAWLAIGADGPSDIAREANGAMMIALTLKLNDIPQGDIKLGIGAASLNITQQLKALPVGGLGVVAIPLSCFATGQNLAQTDTVAQIQTAQVLDIDLSDVRLIETKAGAICPAN